MLFVGEESPCPAGQSSSTGFTPCQGTHIYITVFIATRRRLYIVKKINIISTRLASRKAKVPICIKCCMSKILRLFVVNDTIIMDKMQTFKMSSPKYLILYYLIY